MPESVAVWMVVDVNAETSNSWIARSSCEEVEILRIRPSNGEPLNESPRPSIGASWMEALMRRRDVGGAGAMPGRGEGGEER